MSVLLSFVVPDQILLWATNVLIHTTVLAAVSLLIALLFRKIAVTRYWILCLGMLLVLGSPLISALIQSRGDSLLTLALPVEEAPTSIVPKSTLPIVTEMPAIDRSLDLDRSIEFEPFTQGQTKQSSERLISPVIEMDVAPTPSVVETDTKARLTSDWLRFFLTAVIAIWAIGTTILLLRMSIYWIRMAQILKQSQPVEDIELQRAFEQACATVGFIRGRGPKFVVSDNVSGPIAAGIFGGTVVLPTRLVENVDAKSLANVLVHEVAHVARRDQIVVLVQNLVAALYWPHPLVKMLNRELAKAREEVCDNFVLAGIEAPAYSRTLLSLAELVQQPDSDAGQCRVLH